MNEQRLIQEQQQRLIQQQRLTQQQMMLVKMLEMPAAEMAEHVNTELNDNPALERVDDADDLTPSDNQLDNDDTAETVDEQNERQEPEQPAPRPKKIDPNVGEYVEFEEIKTSSQTTVTDADGTTEYRRVSETVREEQIEDAEWEDL